MKYKHPAVNTEGDRSGKTSSYGVTIIFRQRPAVDLIVSLVQNSPVSHGILAELQEKNILSTDLP
jgi:hypothetical protein